MKVAVKTVVLFVLGTFLFTSQSYAAPQGQPIIGVNLRGYGTTASAQQDTKLNELASYGVKTIREGFPSQAEAQFNRFVVEAYRRGIGMVAIIYPTLGGTGQHTSEVDATVGRRWRVPALIDADPTGFKAAFAAQLAALEDAGVKLTAFEIGNEFNTVGYNADFPAHGSGRILGLADLDNPKDGEARRVASGYLQYIKILAVIKDVRDHSRLNRETPIITGGLSNVGLAGPKSFNGQVATSVADTVTFMRQHGADQFVDGYGVHAYTSGDPHQTLAQRLAVLEVIFHACTSSKPCWLTEWAFNNRDQSCPVNDEVRLHLVEAERATLKHFVDQGRLAASIYYSWDGDFPGQKENMGAIFRCGSLTDAGKLALGPLPK
ncbi:MULTISPECIES: hypothetical protein [Bradyrhizobium]|uniref:hypothetical protein n=1 Tax=Bradyrhizobium elkanii TaxID=29448 RepID=UPI000485CAC3|nr:hypothetical protein [Bradyrhizobium elkanii]